MENWRNRMLLTERDAITALIGEKPCWLGIPGIERTDAGRLFATYYSGHETEQLGNYVPLIVSDDDGATWSKPVAVAYCGEEHRAYDECLWIDPLGRLWFCWSMQPDHSVWAAICDHPDENPLQFRTPIVLGRDVMLNKPIVTSDKRWLFPIATWRIGVQVAPDTCASLHEPRLAALYESTDQGRTFRQIGGADGDARLFDEHMIYERADGSLRMFVRTLYGIGESVSKDGGFHWTPLTDSGLGGPCSRFHLRRLASGNLLLINHVNFTNRNNLTALLSRDDGETWEGGLMLDERNDVSYPDAKQAPDGSIYAIYDRDRCGAGELLMAKFTEADILAGKLVSDGSRLRQTIYRIK